MFLNGKGLEGLDEHQYPGVFVNSCFNDNRDINKQIRATYCRGNIMISKFRKFTNAVKIQLFKTCGAAKARVFVKGYR